MQALQDFTIIKYLLSIIAFIGGINIALITWIARKYIRRADLDHRRINRMEAQHQIFHKDELPG